MVLLIDISHTSRNAMSTSNLKSMRDKDAGLI